MPLSNDDRGWVMTGLSGLACMVGASFICVDLIVRQFPGKAGFKIQDSDAFLSVSLSLSFGVMLFSALYNMLPSSKRSLQDGGYSASGASWILIGCFIGGVIGIQILSRFLHHFMPSHIVDCEHSHEDNEAQKEDNHHHDNHDHHGRDSHEHSHYRGHSHGFAKPASGRRLHSQTTSIPGQRPGTKLRAASHRSANYFSMPSDADFAPTLESEVHNVITPAANEDAAPLRPPLHARITAGISQLTNAQKKCDSNGPCYGYSEVCGQDCFQFVNARGGLKIGGLPGVNRPAATRSITVSESTPLLQETSEEQLSRPRTQAAAEGAAGRRTLSISSDSSSAVKQNGAATGHVHRTHSDDGSDHDEMEHADHHNHHHHHVPANAFLSIGLQTSIAIALHKLPEGFITYATNHANPKLGVSVFLALFIHNITEGFAMALPLYLAINNRIKAMLISFVLGGLSQPLGAGVAALWFKLAGNSHFAPSDAVYGGMFAVTAGIMASVALQLFSESLDLTHSKNLCMIGAFCGMAVLGASSALTA